MASTRDDLDEDGTPGDEGTDLDLVADGVLVALAPAGGAYLMPKSVTRLSGDAADVVAELQSAALARREISDRVEQLVREARDLGASWDAIGWSVGTTGQAARQRWAES
jgi:hypothetical protein